MRGLRSTLALLLWIAIPAAFAAEPSFPVKYRSAGNVYLEAGRAEGLVEGDRLVVLAGTETVAELEVVYLAEQSASCRIVSEKRTVRAGDVALRVRKSTAKPELEPAPQASPPVMPPLPTAIAPKSPSLSTPARPFARVRGGASLGYYRVWDGLPSNLDFEQRTGRLDLNVWDLFGRPYTFDVRFRTRQDLRSRGLSDRNPKDVREDRLYEAALRFEPPSEGFSLELGRIGVSHFVGIGYLDGGLARLRVAGPLQVGGFGGRRADIEALKLGGSGLKYGGFLRLAPAGRYASGGYEAELAFVRETAKGDVSREYLSLETRLGSGRRVMFFGRGELDLNRGWRENVTGARYQLSNISVSGTYRFKTSSSFSLSYDGYRNYRYYLNRDVPEAIFDDLLRQGLRGSVFVGRGDGPSVRAGGGVRLRERPDAVNAYSANLGVRHGDLFGRGISLGVEGSGFTSGYTEGYLALLQAGRQFRSGHFLDASYGHSFYRVRQSRENRVTEWLRFTGRVQLPRGLYLVGDTEYDRGDDLKGPRAFLELGYQF